MTRDTDKPITPAAPPTHGNVYGENDTGGPDHGSPANFPQAGQTKGPRHDGAVSDPTATGTNADPDMETNADKGTPEPGERETED